ncbi:hypothetical protein [Flavobacterium sp. ov086]|uniref:hypothetical protein n=1 Tax=Flavobacterium sp. ov086 TaxID=1761785 RepID=UPI000B6AF8E7|nr:hypothetical protein [Flavobacterium sp. ov086]SNR54628.1 hypothetical protein SAMN04487979_110153 [Flavobacterium sp. ov086]
MEVISGKEFQTIIYSDNAETISDFIVEINTSLNIDLEKVKLSITFSNLKFQGKQIRFYKIKKECLHRFRFDKCTFESNTFIESDFEDITFISNTFNCDKFHIYKSTIGVLEFFDDDSNSENIKNNIFSKGNFKIDECEFNSVFWLKNIKFSEKTNIDFSTVKFHNGCFFDSISLNKIMFYNCDFLKEFRYDIFYNSSTFRECSFLGLTTFSGLPSVNSSFLWFENCHFFKLANFNNYWLHKLRIEETTFSDNVSFQQTYFDIVSFIRIIFEKKVWFDDIRIKKIDECDRITIRTIKQELQKAENRIDFNKFRNYELAAHYKELNFKIDFKDKTILWATKWSSNFGSWTWAFWFTIIIGLIFFTPFYIFENFNKTINLQNWQDFIYGYFRFFLITDFKNEYYQAGESVLKFNCFLSLLPFLFGKIAVAFGIYEMIQSFRKFKA